MGIKESIVLTKAPEGNVLKFRFQAKGLVPKKNILDGGISFLDEKTEDLVATLEAPNMNDHTGRHTVRSFPMTLNQMAEKILIC